ncbi:MAG: helix-turn-helix domain-containing protein [Actinobacteria bacterium]|nr:helix-turn-helix domain-containing protein [Actinomycetota bacterium]
MPSDRNTPNAAETAASRVRDLGGFIREQRTAAQLSLRALASRAGISNPYLSQIERGLRRPSADILQRVADALRISAESLYVQAGMLEERPAGLDEHIRAASELTGSQKRALLEIYHAFVAGDAPPHIPVPTESQDTKEQQ